MKSTFRLIAAVIVIILVAVVSCKKQSTTTTTTTDDATQLSVQSDDQSRFSGEIDAVANDANIVIENNASFNGRVENVLGTLCNATTAIDTTGSTKKITVTYNGLSCEQNRFVTGVVVLSMAKETHWKDAGAVLTIALQNLKITRVRDGKSITINGTKTITNVTGGRLSDLSGSRAITHTITSAGMSITFDDGTQRTWQVAKQRVFTFSNGIVISTTGTHTDGAVSGISEWGANRFGNAFVATINQPLVVRKDCNFRLVSGEVTHSSLAATIVVTFGLDATGVAITCPAGSYYFKLVWTGKGGLTKTVIMPY
ncbi:MAG: hypothetical protein H7334_09455 [Ferruginibacter sp.]|nr:hypothetical protein [Ferruginibacter sp.]